MYSQMSPDAIRPHSTSLPPAEVSDTDSRPPETTPRLIVYELGEGIVHLEQSQQERNSRGGGEGLQVV